MFEGQREAVAIATCEHLILVIATTPPDWPDGVDDILCPEPVAFGDLRLAWWASAQRATLLDKFRTCGAMDCSIYSATAQQRRVRRVDDGIYRQGRDILPHNADTRARMGHQRLLARVSPVSLSGLNSWGSRPARSRRSECCRSASCFLP